MKTGTMRIARGVEIPVLRADTVIVGSGAAGLNCAEQLHAAGVRDILVLTSSLLGGTSYRSGSDKQTYYKLSVFGDAPDSPLDMARALFAGGCMDGETAYIEALYSPRAFFHLVENGVPFPSNAFGAFVGYKTDHDPRQRATSAGPKTSRYMVETSLARIRALGIPILDRMTVVRIVRAGPRKAAAGLVALDGRRTDGPGLGVTAVAAGRIVLAAGGPGELYAETVYPRGQIGLHGPALEAGADMVNLGESQFGIASTRFRWNLSGTYQQVIPSYFSLDEAGRRVDFLPDWYRSAAELAENIFLKGYQWPFNAARAADFGSSRVDMAVHAERAAGRRVFLDFLRSPSYEGATVDVEGLSGEAAAYLRRSGSLQRTPIERLAHMNPESIEIYREHGIDLRDPLEIAVCFQHNNGGIRVDTDWQTTVPGLFAVGEAAGTHGVARPGGSALNAGQTGGFRVARCAARRPVRAPVGDEPLRRAAADVLAESAAMLARGAPHAAVRAAVQRRMTDAAGFLRRPGTVASAAADAAADLRRYRAAPPAAAGPGDLPRAWETRGLVATHAAFLASIDRYIRGGGGSRGSYLVIEETADAPAAGARLAWRPERIEDRGRRIRVSGVPPAVSEEAVSPIPGDESWFETTWAEWKREFTRKARTRR